MQISQDNAKARYSYAATALKNVSQSQIYANAQKPRKIKAGFQKNPLSHMGIGFPQDSFKNARKTNEILSKYQKR